jgi:hypothetical protein
MFTEKWYYKFGKGVILPVIVEITIKGNDMMQALNVEIFLFVICIIMAVFSATGF